MSVMYLPKVDEDTLLIQRRINNLAGPYGAEEAFNELLGMKPYIVGHVLNAWEKPNLDWPDYLMDRYFRNIKRLLTAMIERGDLTLEQLNRYRRLITSEKKQ